MGVKNQFLPLRAGGAAPYPKACSRDVRHDAGMTAFGRAPDLEQ